MQRLFPRLAREARARVALILALACVTSVPAASAEASVFSNAVKWPTSSDGYTVIPVCIAAGSSATQVHGGAIHDPNPSLEDVVGQVRDALRVNWEAYAPVRFVGWRACAALSQKERDVTVGLSIHQRNPNNSAVGVNAKDADGHVDPVTGETHYSTNFKPWGINGQCITYNADRAVTEYRFSCVREYGVHEFGHVLGFLHEWQSPWTPSSCSSTRKAADGQLHEQPIPASDVAFWKDPGRSYTITNLLVGYDWDSIMTYDTECATVTGERFGSPTLSRFDVQGVESIYGRPLALEANDVGVIPDVRGSCPAPREVKIYLDNEDKGNENASSGWTGAIVSGRNTLFEFCRVDGRRLGRLSAPRTGSASYAVLRLGTACPPGSREFVRYHDDEDQPPLNTDWMAGDVGPTRQNLHGTGTGTELHWCVFEQAAAGATSAMSRFPRMGVRYGVVAAKNFSAAVKTGSVYIDDEDKTNKNRPQSAGGVVSALMDIGRNTKINLALTDAPAPQPCERTRTC